MNQGDCDGSFSTTWIEPTGGQVPADIYVGSYSEEVTDGPDYGFASVELAIDPNTCDSLWQAEGAPACSSQLPESLYDTNPADYTISYSSNLTPDAPEPGTTGLGLIGAALLLARYRRLRTAITGKNL